MQKTKEKKQREKFQNPVVNPNDEIEMVKIVQRVPSSQIPQACENCAFYAPDNDYVGRCRALPPTSHFLGFSSGVGGGPPQPITEGYFPVVRRNLWCGWWKLRID